jgi:hypothetical protein
VLANKAWRILTYAFDADGPALPDEFHSFIFMREVQLIAVRMLSISEARIS